MKQEDREKQEASLADDLQLTTLLKRHPDFLARHPQILAELEVPHETGTATSLIERQVDVLRDRLNNTEKRMRSLVEIARDNDRLAQSRHRLALNLIGARELDEVVSSVLDELSNELDAEFAVVRLFETSSEQATKRPQLFLGRQGLEAFSTMLRHRNPVCGRSTEEQKNWLFGENAGDVASAAIIPLAAGSELGLLGLGSRDARRFHSAMGIDFLRSLGELISAALAVHIERDERG